MIISIDAKHLSKIQWPFKTNTQQSRDKREFPQPDNAIANIILNGEKLNMFPLSSGTKQNVFLAASIKHCTGRF